MAKWKTWTAAVSIFVFGVLVGREWMKYKVRSAIAGAFSGLSGGVEGGEDGVVDTPAVRPVAAPARPAVRPVVPLRMKQKGIRSFAGNGCQVTYEIESRPEEGSMIHAFAVGEGDAVLESTIDMLQPVGRLVEFGFLRTPCSRIKGLRWQVQ